MSILEVSDLSVRYGGLTIVERVSFSVAGGCWMMLIGPNGAGKSTIVSAISRGAQYTGQVRLCGRDIARLRARDMARDMGVLAQRQAVGYDFTVEQVVHLGRYAHRRGPFSAAGGGDEGAVARALELVGMTAQRGQSVLKLSGGELQRTFLAQVLAQEPRLLVLDEPTNHLDLNFQQQTFALIRAWLAQGGKGGVPERAVLSVVHDLSLARAYGSEALLLDRGRVAARGCVEAVFAPEALRRVYSMDVYAWMRSMLAQWQPQSDISARADHLSAQNP